jgi:hypothetical protein
MNFITTLTGNSWGFLLPREKRGGDMKMLKDMGNQSYIWSSFSGFLAWLGDQNNLMVLSLIVGIVTALVNAYSKCAEGKALKRDEQRKDEIHTLTVQRLKQGLRVSNDE